jgi:hypothetical protein
MDTNTRFLLLLLLSIIPPAKAFTIVDIIEAIQRRSSGYTLADIQTGLGALLSEDIIGIVGVNAYGLTEYESLVGAYPTGYPRDGETLTITHYNHAGKTWLTLSSQYEVYYSGDNPSECNAAIALHDSIGGAVKHEIVNL